MPTDVTVSDVAPVYGSAVPDTEGFPQAKFDAALAKKKAADEAFATYERLLRERDAAIYELDKVRPRGVSQNEMARLLDMPAGTYRSALPKPRDRK